MYEAAVLLQDRLRLLDRMADTHVSLIRADALLRKMHSLVLGPSTLNVENAYRFDGVSFAMKPSSLYE